MEGLSRRVSNQLASITRVKSGAEEPPLPDFHTKFVSNDDLIQFEKALNAPEALSLVAINDWRPIHQRVRSSRPARPAARRTKDETREGFVYTLTRWPLLLFVLSWILVLSILYVVTRLYIFLYEYLFAWTGKRQRLRRGLRLTNNYEEWQTAAKRLDNYLGNDKWRDENEYAYYDHATVSKVTDRLKQLRITLDGQNGTTEGEAANRGSRMSALEELRALLEGCVKNNFGGIENPRLYSETYFGTKTLVQDFVDEMCASLNLVLDSSEIPRELKHELFQHLDTNYGKSVLCLSGGATLSYYHFGVIKALLDAEVLPKVISGTSGGALVAAMVATHKDSELDKLLVPQLAGKIRACQDGFKTWFKRWWRTGARFDTMAWARQCSWFCRGSMTFREAYERTGRILNVSCVPSDPHSPTILANYKTSPNCVIWSAVIASAAVPGILNPVVLMMKKPDGSLAPYSFGHKWKDGSLRTDIPLKALDVHFNASFPIVSQVNPHISLFFFSSRGSIGRPVTHRKGRGWRGGFLGSATEQYLKLDLNKWLKVLRHLELMPRPLGQDWSKIWLQRFSSTVTIWPRTVLSDLYYILSDPSPQRLARMIREGQHSTFPKLKFISNRMKLEKVIAEGARRYPTSGGGPAWPKEETQKENMAQPPRPLPWEALSARRSRRGDTVDLLTDKTSRSRETSQDDEERANADNKREKSPSSRRRSSMVEEFRRQTAVFFDDPYDSGSHDEGGNSYGGRSKPR